MWFFRKSEIGKIYETTDGYLADNPRNKKKRKVVAIEKRKKDGAIAVSKIRKLENKDTSKNYIKNLVLSPDQHPALTEKSVVEHRVIWGVKEKGKWQPITTRKLTPTKDRLTLYERRKLKKGVGGPTKQNRRTYKNTRRSWQKGFANKKNK